MISLDKFLGFISFRPGLSAAAGEWRECLGTKGWDNLRGKLFMGDGIASVYHSPGAGRSLHVTAQNDGTYALVCNVTGNVENTGISKEDVVNYRLCPEPFREMIAESLGISLDPQAIRELPRAFALGTWSPVAGENIPAYLILPPTSKLLLSEINRLLVETAGGFLLFVPNNPRLETATLDYLDRKESKIIPLGDVLEWGGSEGLRASDGWRMCCNTYCQKHLTDQMSSAQPEYQFARKGMWSILYRGVETILDGNLKGAAFIHHLLSHQGSSIHVVRLMAQVAGVQKSDRNPAAEGLSTDQATADNAVDDTTKRECQEKYDSLVAEREYANDNRLQEIEKEISQIAAYLSSSLGLGGKSRKLGDEVAAARRRIARVIGTAIDKIGEHDQNLATHLRNSIRTHTEMVYEPDCEVNWVLT